MNPNIHALFALSAVVLASCVPDRQSIEVLGSFSPEVTDECTITGTTSGAQQLAGTLNLAYANQYVLTLSLKNNLEVKSGINGSSPPITQDGANDFFVREMEVEYTCVDSAQRCGTFPRLAPQVVPLSGNIKAQSEFVLLTNILVGEAGEKMREKLGEEPVNSTMSIKFRGDFAHGVGFETASYVYPVTVSNAELASVTCDSGVPTLVSRYSCAYLKGQDSQIVCAAQ